MRKVQDNKKLNEEDKIASTNFAHYHLTVLSIILHDLEDRAREKFPEAKGIIDWTMDLYKVGLEKKTITPCKCVECKELT